MIVDGGAVYDDCDYDNDGENEDAVDNDYFDTWCYPEYFAIIELVHIANTTKRHVQTNEK